MSRRMSAAATATFVQVTMGVAMGMDHMVGGRASMTAAEGKDRESCSHLPLFLHLPPRPLHLLLSPPAQTSAADCTYLLPPSDPMTSSPLLSITSLTSPSFHPDTPPLFHSLAFSLSLPGQILVLRGPSGSGKSVVLKCLAELLVYPSGSIELKGKNAASMGYPKWRSRVLYLPQRPALLPGTPGEFWETLIGFKSRNTTELSGVTSRARKDPRELAELWGVSRESWNQSWGSLSGGEAQRIALAVGLALEPEVLLLDGSSLSFSL